ncbi:ATP-dependent DNA helicase sgs1, partial [Coemansia sp. RSA 2610]
VRPKSSKSILADINALITTRHPGESGIIYCKSKKDCEQMAHDLRATHQLRAEHYHAGLEKEDRIRVQQMWQRNELQVIVATVAFGMGIDKPDVRFVIHHSLPTSLEGYYQETGRAGRDGNSAICVLFYTFADKSTLDYLIDRGDGDWDLKERQRQQVRQVIQFCENTVDCRRQLVLSYFGEQFDASQCKNTCDNCRSRSAGSVVQVDKTKEARLILESVRMLEEQNSKTTLLQLIDIVRGSKGKRVIDRGDNRLPAYSCVKDLSKNDADRLCHQLVLLQVIEEYCVNNARGFVNSYIKRGRYANSVLYGQRPVILRTLSATSQKTAAAAAKPKQAAGSSSKGRAASWDTNPPISNGAKRPSSSGPGGGSSSTVATNSTSKHFRAANAPSALKAMAFRNPHF